MNKEIMKGDLKFIYEENYNTNYNKVFRSVVIKKKRKNGVYARIRKMNLSENEIFEEYVKKL
mgnify:FL=1